jgi:hypothetical protein
MPGSSFAIGSWQLLFVLRHNAQFRRVLQKLRVWLKEAYSSRESRTGFEFGPVQFGPVAWPVQAATGPRALARTKECAPLRAPAATAWRRRSPDGLPEA